MAAQPNAPLQGKITEFAPVKTFQEVIDSNPDVQFDSLPDEDRGFFAGEYLKKYVFSKPEWEGGLTPEDREDYLTAFNQKYNVGQLQQPKFADPVSEAVGKLVDFGNLATLGVPARSFDAANFGASNLGQDRDNWLKSEYPGIESDPGLYGNLFRLSQNDTVKSIAGLPGVFKGTANLTKQLPANTLANIPKLTEASRKALAATGLFSGGTNLANVMQGRMNPVEGLANTAFETVTAPIQLAGRVGNAALQGAIGGVGGGLSSVLSSAANGQPIDPQQLMKAIQSGALFSGAMGAALPGEARIKPDPKTPRFDPQTRAELSKPLKGAVAVNQFIPTAKGEQAPVSFVKGGLLERAALNEKQKLQKAVDTIQNMRSVDEKQSLTGQLRELKKLYEILEAVSKAPGVPQEKQMATQAMKGRVLESYKAKKAEYDSKFSREAVKAQNAKPQASKDVINKAVKSGVKARMNGKVASTQFNQYLERTFSKPERKLINAKVTDKVAEVKAKQVEARRVASEQLLAKAKTPQTNPEPARQSGQSQESILREAYKAKDKGLTARIEYEAEGGKSGKGGERLASAYRFKNDTILESRINKSGDIELKTINNEGQLTTRLLDEKTSGSRIVTLKTTDEPARYALNDDGDVVELKTGKVIEQSREQGTFSSEIRYNMEQMERIVQNYKKNQARVGDIMNTTKPLTDEQYSKTLDDNNSKIYKDSTGKNC